MKLTVENKNYVKLKPSSSKAKSGRSPLLLLFHHSRPQTQNIPNSQKAVPRRISLFHHFYYNQDHFTQQEALHVIHMVNGRKHLVQEWAHLRYPYNDQTFFFNFFFAEQLTKQFVQDDFSSLLASIFANMKSCEATWLISYEN